MRGTGKDKLRETKLLNAPQSLEWRSLDDLPKRVLKMVRIEFNEIVKRVSNSLRFRLDHSLRSLSGPTAELTKEAIGGGANHIYSYNEAIRPDANLSSG
jgi:hypothetical protein